MIKISKITRRDYANVELQFEGGEWLLRLDDALICTNEGRVITSASETLMQHIAREWQAQQGAINITNMPQTRMLASKLDLTQTQMQAMRQLLMEYAANEMLTMLETTNLNILSQVEAFLSVKYELHTQLIPPPQPHALLMKVQTWLEALPPKTLLTHYVLTQTLGSLALSVATIHLQLPPQQIMQAAWLEHDSQMQKWGVDDALMQKRNYDESQLNDCLIFQNIS